MSMIIHNNDPREFTVKDDGSSVVVYCAMINDFKNNKGAWKKFR
jgi:hypothetical protein